jgi:hypothetical protein
MKYLDNRLNNYEINLLVNRSPMMSADLLRDFLSLEQIDSIVKIEPIAAILYLKDYLTEEQKEFIKSKGYVL